VPHPSLLTLTHVGVFKEEWSFATPQHNDLPQEEESGVVEGSEAHKAAKDKHLLGTWVVSFIKLHQDEQLVAREECAHPEKHIHRQISRKHNSEKATLEPLFNGFQVLERRA
jgi:hypothetical protein